jgi:cob(I)alamin adenosyltransferase
MGITTKKGDDGITSLLYGKKVMKNNPRVEGYGTLEELSSFMGAAKSLIREKKIKEILESIQKDLFTIGSEIATAEDSLDKLKLKISAEEVKIIEKAINDLEKKEIFEECCFYLSGDNFVSSLFEIARAVARRAERNIITLKQKKKIQNKYIWIYLNRVSDLLYLLARFYEKKHTKFKIKGAT